MATIRITSTSCSLTSASSQRGTVRFTFKCRSIGGSTQVMATYRASSPFTVTSGSPSGPHAVRSTPRSFTTTLGIRRTSSQPRANVPITVTAKEIGGTSSSTRTCIVNIVGTPLQGEELGARLRAHRAERALTQTAVARRLRLSPSTIGRLERGVVTPSETTRHKVERLLGRD